MTPPVWLDQCRRQVPTRPCWGIIGRTAVLTLIASAMTGCVPWLPPVPIWTSQIRYDPAGDSAVPPLPPLDPFTLYQFRDLRGLGSTTRIGDNEYEYMQRGRRMTMRGAYLFTSDPVAITITRAFMKGFAARGFPVVDRTAVTFAPPEPDQSTRLALAGEVVHFYARSVVSAEAPDTTVTVGCVVNLRIYGAAGGDPFWEGRYSKYEFTKEPFGGDLGIAFTRVLSKVIQNAMNDPTFLAQLRRTS